MCVSLRRTYGLKMAESVETHMCLCMDSDTHAAVLVTKKLHYRRVIFTTFKSRFGDIIANYRVTCVIVMNWSLDHSISCNASGKYRFCQVLRILRYAIIRN